MNSIGLIGGGIVVGLALMHNSSSTVKHIVVVISVRGIAWIMKKVVASMNTDASQIIDFTGWSLAGVSLVGIIKNALGAVGQIKQVGENLQSGFNSIAQFIDKLTFWD